MKAYVDETGSPMGTIVFATDEEGALLGLQFASARSRESLERRLEREGFELGRAEHRAAGNISPASQQLAEYFAGERRSFELEVARGGTAFQEAVWEELSRIPFGQRRTYGDLAGAAGHRGEAIEAGKACAANPVLLVVPCHRVVGSDGSLKGYAGGTSIKRRLLSFEGTGQKALFV